MIVLKELESGNLEIKIDPEADRIEMENLIDVPLNTAFGELLEESGYVGNNWHNVMPEEIGALTDSPIIAYGAIYAEENDQDLPIGYEKLWWFPQYEVEDPIETLLRNGVVIFTRASQPVKKQKILTWEDFAPYKPCYNPAERYGEWSGTMLDLLDRKDIPVDDRVWALTTGVAWDVSPEKNLRLFACKCVREIWELLTDYRSRNAVEVAEKFAKGEAASEDLKAAQEAARAAREAAEAAVWAARAAVWAARAACAAAEGATREAARAAVWATREAARAACAAAEGAAQEAARAAAREVQIEIAKTLI